MAANFTGQVIDNVLLSRIDAPIGTYRQSDLTLEQFLDETPGQWVLADGQSCEGSAYASKTGKNNVPDLRGSFMRTKDHGKGNDTERDLGNYQADEFKSHKHVLAQATETGTYAGAYGVSGIGWAGLRTNLTNTIVGTLPYSSTVGGTETRPKNVVVNTFIKIGY